MKDCKTAIYNHTRSNPEDGRHEWVWHYGKWIVVSISISIISKTSDQ